MQRYWCRQTDFIYLHTVRLPCSGRSLPLPLTRCHCLMRLQAKDARLAARGVYGLSMQRHHPGMQVLAAAESIVMRFVQDVRLEVSVFQLQLLTTVLRAGLAVLQESCLFLLALANLQPNFQLQPSSQRNIALLVLDKLQQLSLPDIGSLLLALAMLTALSSSLWNLLAARAAEVLCQRASLGWDHSPRCCRLQLRMWLCAGKRVLNAIDAVPLRQVYLAQHLVLSDHLHTEQHLYSLPENLQYLADQVPLVVLLLMLLCRAAQAHYLSSSSPLPQHLPRHLMPAHAARTACCRPVCARSSTSMGAHTAPQARTMVH